MITGSLSGYCSASFLLFENGSVHSASHQDRPSETWPQASPIKAALQPGIPQTTLGCVKVES